MIIKPANRINSIREYYFSGKTREIEQLNQNGPKVINLGIGSPDMAPDANVIENLRNEALLANNHSYQSYKGIREIREAFAGFYKRYYHVTLDPETEIQLLNGSKEGILLVSLAFLNKGDKVLVPNPGYPTYSSATRLAEAEVINYNLIESNGWLPDFDELEKMNLTGVKIMWVNYPNMPTGASANLEVYQRLIDFGNKHGILIANDNPYSFILTEKQLSIFDVRGAKNCCVELNSMSKAFNMAGWRIGIIAGNQEIIDHVLKVKSNMDSGMFRPLQIAASQALALDETWFERLNIEYGKRQKLAGEIFQELDVNYNENSCGLFLWGKVNKNWKNGQSLSDKLLRDARVFITPGFVFGSNGDKFLRISLCSNEEVFLKAKQRIRSSFHGKGFQHGSFC